MKQLLLLSTCLLSIVNVQAQNGILKGTVTAGKKALEYCTVYINKASLGASTDANGHYEIRNIPAGTYTITISSVGYQKTEKNVIINAGRETISDIEMFPGKNNNLNEVVVTGVSKATLVKENPLAIEVISAKQITQTATDNTIDAIAKNAPGLQTVKTGPNVSKPFINGLGYNRVLTLYDGLRVETQQWGDEHGVPMDDYIIERAEVIKGPASLMYGSDAIAGVLSMFPTIPADNDRTIHGKFLSEYQTNNGLIGNSLNLMHGSGKWLWAIRGSERVAKNYTDPVDGRVYNTSFRMYNASAFLGYRGKNGYSHLNATVYDNRQGIPDGSRDSLTRQFTYQVYETKGENVLQPHTDNITSRPIVPQNVLNSYDISPLSQRIQDYRFYTDNFYHIGQSDVTASVGFEQNRRREFDHPTDIDQAGEYIVLNTLDYNFRVNCPSVLHIEPSVGINGMYQSNSNKNATDFPIPDYRLFDIGSYIYGKWKHNRWTIAGGIRYDHRSENGDEMYIRPNLKTGFYQKVGATDTAGATMQFPAFRLQFEGVTGSIGTTYRINEYLSLKGNIARGYRAPNITEIASDGLDPGAHIYYVGNLGFKPEFSLQEDMGLNGSYPDLSFNLSVFDNYIENYIYEDQEVDKNGNPIVIVPGSKTFQYQQTNAQLYGGDATLNIHPQKWKRWDFDNTFSIVYGYNLNKKYQNAGVQGQYLPFVPPPKLLSSVSYNLLFNNKILPSLNLKGSIDYNAAQHRYLGLYNTETPTPAYWLIDVSVHTDIYYSEKHAFQLLLAVNNLLNTAYQSHLSRLQYFEYYTYSPNGHYGIYNMGRNLCFKIIIPF